MRISGCGEILLGGKQWAGRARLYGARYERCIEMEEDTEKKARSRQPDVTRKDRKDSEGRTAVK